MSDFEHRLLAKLTTPQEMAEAWESGVRAEVFEMPLYKTIWDFSVDYWRKSQRNSVPTAFILAERFPGYTQSTDVTEETWYLASELRQRFVINNLQEMLRKAAKDSTDPLEGPMRALKTLHASAYSALEVVQPRATRVNMADNIEERWARYATKEQFPQGMGAPYGLDLLDHHTGGIEPGEVAVVAAFAKCGKTMLLCNAATAAVRKGYKPIVFTLELGLHEIQLRLDAFYSGVSYNRLTHWNLHDSEKEQLLARMVELKELGGIPVERPEEGDRTVAYLCSRARELGCDYLIIDQLSKMEPGHRTDTIKERRASVITSLKNEVSRAGIELPCLIAHQLRREESDEPTLKSLAEAAEIEREVDLVLALHRTSDMRTNHVMACDILGSRRTDIFRYLLNWELTERTEISTLREGG